MRWPGNLVLVVCALLLVSSASASTEIAPSAAVGYWSGNIDMPLGPMDVQVTLAQDEAGWAGRIDIPAQGIHGLALDEIGVTGQEVRFAMKGVAGDPRFFGHVAADGGSIVGTFNHGGRTMPFSLSRSNSPPADLAQLFAGYIEPGVPGEGLAGHWRGLMQAGMSKLRVEMNIAEGEDGALTGSVLSPDQGAVEVAISSVTVEDEKVLIDVGAVFGRFDGFMVDDGTTLVGQWIQNKVSFPIRFMRQAVQGEGAAPGKAVSGN